MWSSSWRGQGDETETRIDGRKRSRRASSSRAVPFVVLLPALMTLPACYAYVPLDPSAVAPGEEVRLVVSYETLRSSSPLAPLRSESVEGRFVNAGDDSLGVSVWIGRAYRGTPFETVYETFTVPRRDVVRIERRQLSKWRTGLVALAAVVGIGVLADRVGLIESSNPPNDGGNPPGPPTGILRD